jgi:hypothetical protein
MGADGMATFKLQLNEVGNTTGMASDTQQDSFRASKKEGRKDSVVSFRIVRGLGVRGFLRELLRERREGRLVVDLERRLRLSVLVAAAEAATTAGIATAATFATATTATLATATATAFATAALGAAAGTAKAAALGTLEVSLDLDGLLRLLLRLRLRSGLLL